MTGGIVNLRMLRHGMLAGLAFLVILAVIEWWLDNGHAQPVAGAVRLDDGVGDQVWQVLAEARRILEESA